MKGIINDDDRDLNGCSGGILLQAEDLIESGGGVEFVLQVKPVRLAEHVSTTTMNFSSK